MTLKPYIWDIYQVGVFNDVDIGVARDMFIKNMELGENEYKGADVDYASLGEQWNAMSGASQAFQKNEYSRITHASNELAHPAWIAQDRAAFDAALAVIE